MVLNVRIRIVRRERRWLLTYETEQGWEVHAGCVSRWWESHTRLKGRSVFHSDGVLFWISENKYICTKRDLILKTFFSNSAIKATITRLCTCSLIYGSLHSSLSPHYDQLRLDSVVWEGLLTRRANPLLSNPAPDSFTLIAKEL